jgi:hypothetical protein
MATSSQGAAAFHPGRLLDHVAVKRRRLGEVAEAISAPLDLSWKWEATAAPTDAPARARGPLPIAARPQVERLLEHIQIDRVRGIGAEIALLAEVASTHRKLVTAFSAALDQFDLAGMAKLLEQP